VSSGYAAHEAGIRRLQFVGEYTIYYALEEHIEHIEHIDRGVCVCYV